MREHSYYVEKFNNADLKKDIAQLETTQSLVLIFPTWRFSFSSILKLEVFENPKLLEEKEDYICWLGHASFLIQIDGKKLVTDPCLTSPTFIKRLTKVPFEIKDIKPDYLLISHGHYDHLDSDTLKHFNNSTALTPLGMSELINDMNPTIKIQEAGWYQQYEIDEHFEVILLLAHQLV